MKRKKILFICGSPNQTSMMHEISRHLAEHDLFFTPYYCDGFFRTLQRHGLLDFTIIGGQNRRNTEAYLAQHRLAVDYAGQSGGYDLIFTCTDLLVQKNLAGRPVILVQEGMTDPERLMFHVVRHTHHLGVPRWLASTSTTGLSDCYVKFCVASDGYRKHFERKGVRSEKLAVTGIPNFDNAAVHLENNFPHRDYVLVATTDTRENFKIDNRRRFLRRCVELAEGKPLIFKLHPNEDPERSRREIAEEAPGSLVFQNGNTNHMVANCSTLITQYSSVVYVGIALGKKVHSYFDLNELHELAPIQNGGASGRNIAEVGREFL